MDNYNIGIRLRGFSKRFFREEKEKINNDEGKYVPHITILRPFCTNNESELIKIFEQTLVKYEDPIQFQITDFDYFNNDKKILYGRIKDSGELREIRNGLNNSLEEIINFKHPKIGNDYNPHVTISIEENENSLDKLDKEDLPINQYLLRICLLKNKLVLREYDFYLKKSLARDEAKDDKIFKDTIKKLHKKIL
jgi:2'-5' RNA ligase